MEVEHILRDFGLILGAGLLSQLAATLLRVPEMIVLVAVGALIGPSVLGIASNPLNGAGAQLIFTMGVSLILFHGGVGTLTLLSGAVVAVFLSGAEREGTSWLSPTVGGASMVRTPDLLSANSMFGSAALHGEMLPPRDPGGKNGWSWPVAVLSPWGLGGGRQFITHPVSVAQR